jgi:hypothetical protein
MLFGQSKDPIVVCVALNESYLVLTVNLAHILLLRLNPNHSSVYT